MSTETAARPYAEALNGVLETVIASAAAEVDRAGVFPRAAIDALGREGLLGLISASEVGGRGLAHREAVNVVQRIAEHCTSTAMVICMHYAAAAVIEAHGPAEVRCRIAAGEALATLALSETGSRSQFWAPMSTATRANGAVALDARKSWVTSAGEADYYVWSSRPLSAQGASSLWLVPASATGLSVTGAFDGLGLRGNASRPMSADGMAVPAEAMLGGDGAGFEIMVNIVLPYFQLMSAGICAGIMEASTRKAAAHVMAVRYEHLDQAVGESPIVQSHLARMRVKTDLANALLQDALDAVELGRPDAMLRVLEVKAAAGESACEVTDLAMRVCGGAAFRKEAGVERHFRDARAANVMAPTADALYGFIGKAVCGLPLF